MLYYLKHVQTCQGRICGVNRRVFFFSCRPPAAICAECDAAKLLLRSTGSAFTWPRLPPTPTPTPGHDDQPEPLLRSMTVVHTSVCWWNPKCAGSHVSLSVVQHRVCGCFVCRVTLTHVNQTIIDFFFFCGCFWNMCMISVWVWYWLTYCHKHMFGFPDCHCSVSSWCFHPAALFRLPNA